MAGEDKTEKASPKKRRDERKKGNVFQSKDVVTVGVIAISFLMLNFWSSYIFKYTSNVLYKYISLTKSTYSINDYIITQTFKDIAFTVLASAGLLMVSVIVATIVLTGAQT